VREWKKIVERFADAFFGLDKLVHAAFERFDRRAGCDIVEKIAPDDRLRIFVRHTCFVLIVRNDGAVVVDDDGAERQLVESFVGNVDDPPEAFAIGHR